MFIQTEPTSDPATIKFLPGRQVLADGTLDMNSAAEAERSPLAKRLFAIPGVVAVSFGADYVCVTQREQNWSHLKLSILSTIMEHFVTLRPNDLAVSGNENGPDGPTSETRQVDRIRDALREVIDPEIGYNIVDLGLVYDVFVSPDGVARIVMTMTTPGCPATHYLKAGVSEAAARVSGVQAVDVSVTYEPPWTPEMMSTTARAALGIA